MNATNENVSRREFPAMSSGLPGNDAGAALALLDAAADAIVMRDFADQIQFWNRGAARLYGWSAGEVCGRTMSGLLLDDTTAAAEALRGVQEDGAWSGEMRHRNRQGDPVFVHSRWTLVTEANGLPAGILIVSRELAELRRPTARLLRMQRVDCIGALAGGLAHDLNNLFAPVQISVALLKDESLSSEALACVDSLDACAQRGAELVKQVLAIARGWEGARAVFHPKHILAEVLRVVRETFPRSIDVQHHVTKGSWTIEADPAQLQQALLTLCVLARDAMPSGGTLTLRLDVTRGESVAPRPFPGVKAGDYAVFTVAHTGAAMAGPERDRCFNPLGDATGSMANLPLVMGVAEAHGGFVLVDSAGERGTRFQFHVPAREAVGGTAGVKENSRPPKGRGEDVLVIDDEPAMLKVIEAILSRNNYQPVMAADGREALALMAARKRAVRVVISDVLMPGLDGATTIRELRELLPEARVLAMSGRNSGATAGLVRLAGADGYLQKPFTAEQLLAAIEAQLAPGG